MGRLPSFPVPISTMQAPRNSEEKAGSFIMGDFLKGSIGLQFIGGLVWLMGSFLGESPANSNLKLKNSI